MNNSFTYLLVNLGILLFPLLFSFEKKISYFSYWKFLFPSFLITSLLFLTWDYYFTLHGIWGFNAEYVRGIYLGNLPLEEIMFFFVIPFSSIFIYMFLNRFWPGAGLFDKYNRHISTAILAIAFCAAFFNWGKAYTMLNCFYIICLLGLQLFIIRGKYMGRFFRFYIIHLIPFFIVNSILTGTGLSQPVVWYNNNENMGIRLGTIPIEDMLYSMSLMLMNISLFEYFKEQAFVKKIQTQLK